MNELMQRVARAFTLGQATLEERKQMLAAMTPETFDFDQLPAQAQRLLEKLERRAPVG